MPAITELHEIDLHSGHITKPRWSPDGRYLAVPTQSGFIAIFDIDTGNITQTLGPHSGEVTAVAWDRKSEFILSGSLDRSVGLWEQSSGNRRVFTLSGHAEPVHSVEWTDEEAFAMTCSSDRVRAWDGCCLLTGWTKEMEDAANKYTELTMASCSFKTTFLLGMAAENGALLVLTSLLSANLLDSVRMREPIRCLVWSPVEELLAVGTGQSILVFRATQEGFAGPARELTAHTPHVHALDFSGDGTLLASRDADGLKIWDIETATLTAELHENIETRADRFPPAGIAFHPTKPWLAAVSPNGTAFRILDLSELG
jgi:WD40 repeat protein